MFERDWQRATGKDKFTSMLCRENKTNAAGKSDKQAMQEVHDVLQKHYQVGAGAVGHGVTSGHWGQWQERQECEEGG
jgi:hypothetical protein